MSRWAPDARQRLLRAALELFVEQGYDATTTAQIALRAGMSKPSFFRLFSDKREVVLAWQDDLRDVAASEIRALPAPVEAMDAALSGVLMMAAAHSVELRPLGHLLSVALRDSDQLQERAALKNRGLEAALQAALQERGIEPLQAELAAHVGCRAYSVGFDEWVQPGRAGRSLSALVAAAFADYRRAVTTL